MPVFTRLFDTKGLHPAFYTSIFRLSAARNVYHLNHKPHASLLFMHITAAIIVINKVQALFLAFASTLQYLAFPRSRVIETFLSLLRRNDLCFTARKDSVYLPIRVVNLIHVWRFVIAGIRR